VFRTLRRLGVPESHVEHLALMFDLMAIAYQADVTRIFTFYTTPELSQMTYPEAGVTEPHHSISHHNSDPEKLAALAAIGAYYSQHVARFVGKLQAMPEADGTVLDSSMICYGSGLSNSNIHSHVDLPLIVLGGQFAGNRHLRFEGLPLANFWVTLANTTGASIERFGNSTGPSPSDVRTPMRNRHVVLASMILAASAALAQGAGVDARLLDAVKGGNREAVRTMLKQGARELVNVPEADGTTALHWAVRRHDGALVEMLLGAGANAAAASRYGVTPLSMAATGGDAAIVDRLLKAGADPNTTVADGETVLMLAARTGEVNVIRSLVARGAVVNAKENWMGETPLIWAAAENNVAAIHTLVELGADVNAVSAP
jgi:hypothetical protein